MYCKRGEKNDTSSSCVSDAARPQPRGPSTDSSWSARPGRAAGLCDLHRHPAGAQREHPERRQQQSGRNHVLSGGGHLRKQYVKPKAGNKFIGAVGAILDGQNTTVRAFDGNASNVTIQNLIIQNYEAGYQNAPIYAVNAEGWRVRNNEIRNNAGVGLLFKSDVIVQYNNIHHNLELGLSSDGGIGIQVLDNEVAFNNYTDKFDCDDECGGSKLWDTNGAVISYNYSHDNHGPGFWDDFNNQNITYSFNRIENNHSIGIHHEIGYNASIHDNVILGNGKKSKSSGCDWLWCSGISIAASGGVGGGLVEIYNNTITTAGPDGNAIGLIQQDRSGPGEAGKPSLGGWHVQNVWVHDNTIDLSKGGNIGGVQAISNNAMFIASIHNNRFDRNHYILGTNNKSCFSWNDKNGGKAFWQGQGMDLNGTFN